MPLRTQNQRRLLVILYYAALLLFSALGLWKGKRDVQFLIPQVLTFGGLLGGIKIGGPVKVYAEPRLPLDMDSSVQTLNLAGRKPFSSVWSPLDERERSQRNVAHYHAYRILCWTLGAVCCAYWLSLIWNYQWLSSRGPILAWILLVYVLSLPQAVLLWTEPEEPTGELVVLPRT
jgi:hypothetical protein